MSDLMTAPNQRHDITDRVVRFLGWFGVVYGSLGTLATASIVRILWAEWVRSIASGQILREAYRIIDLFFLPICIFLVVCSIGAIRGWRRARLGLFIWAVVLLGIHLVYIGYMFRTIRTRTFWSYNLGWPLRVLLVNGFPLMVLVITSMREIARAAAKNAREGFRVIFDASGEEHAGHPQQVINTSFAGDFCRIFPWIAAIFAVLALALPVINSWSGERSWIFHDRPRMVIVNVLNFLKPISYALLLAGSVGMLFRRAAGTKLVLIWTLLFIVMAIGTFFLYDIMLIWWSANEAKSPFQTWPELLISRAYQSVEEAGLAIVLFYLFRQPEIAAANQSH